MKNWISYYFDNIQNWDLLHKLPKGKVGNEIALMNSFPYIQKIVFLSKLKLSNESDFRIIKMMNFLIDLFRGVNINIQVNKNISSLVTKGGKQDRFVDVSFIVRNDNLSLFLMKLMTDVKINLIKKQVPYTYGIDSLGIAKITLKDIGEMGVENLRYEYFGWQDNFTIIIYFSTNDYELNNLSLSYINMKFLN